MSRTDRWVFCALLATSAGLVPATGAAQIAPGGGGFWSMFRHSPEHHGRAPVVGPDAPSLEWSAALSGLTYSSAAVASDGTVYVGSDGYVFAYAPDGSLRWATEVGGSVISSPAIGTGGLIYVGCRDHHVYALDAQTGAIRWRFATGGEVWSSPAIGRDGTVYVGSFDEYLYALSPSSGAERWRFHAGGEVGASPAVGPDGTVYVGSMNGLLHAIQPNGQRLWQQFVQLGTELASSPAVQAGRVFLGSLDGSLYAFDAASGAVVWAFATADEIVSSPAVGEDGSLYIGSADGSLYAVDATGQERWRVTTGDRIMSSPAIDQSGTVYVGGLDGVLYAVGSTGEVAWTLRAGTSIWSSPALDPTGALIFTTTGTPSIPGRLHRVVAAPFSVSFQNGLVAGQATQAIITRPRSFSPTSGTLYYREGGRHDYEAIPIPIGPVPEFSVPLPAEVVTMRGLEYYVSLTDGRSTATLPPRDAAEHPLRVQVRVQETPVPLDLLPRAYQMVSVPLLLDEQSAASTFEDDYGPHDPAEWRLFGWANGAYQEHPRAPLVVAPGTGLLLVTQTAVPFDVGPGWSVPTDAPVSLRLEPGWNLIGNPFAFPISLDEVLGEVEHVAERAYFDGREMLQDEASVALLRPFQGVFLRNDDAGPITIHIPPIEAADPTPDPLDDFHGALLRLSLHDADGRPVDTQNWVGFRQTTDPDLSHSGNTRRRSLPDLREAPRLNDGISLSIVRDGERYARLLSDSDADATWRLEVTNDGGPSVRGSAVSLRMDGDLPDGATLHLFQEETGSPLPLVDGVVRLKAPARDASDRYVLAIGDASFVDAARPANRTLQLHQNYPNPFADVTSISFHVDRSGHVTLEVFDLLGRRVRTLVNEMREAEVAAVQWDGTNNTGHPLPSGSYFYRLTTELRSVTRSLTILR